MMTSVLRRIETCTLEGNLSLPQRLLLTCLSLGKVFVQVWHEISIFPVFELFLKLVGNPKDRCFVLRPSGSS
jgi:hypothetical protein